MLLSLMAMAAPAFADDAAAAAPVVDSGNTAWLLVSSALVMIMTPGLAFFYAGMVNRKNVVSTLLQNFVALGVVGLIWVLLGYSIAFSDGNALIGDFSYFLLEGIDNQLYPGDAHVPHYAFMAFQMMFAVITPALITGAIAERVHFKAWIFLMALWSIFVYCPIAHWVWTAKGWIAADGGLDFAGGLVVHLSAGVAALVAALMFGKRNYVPEESRPNDVSMIMLGAALLWFGWFGFNAGSAISSGFLAAHAFVTTFIGAAAAMVAWIALDWALGGKPGAVGAAIGLVVGLVIVTPAAGFVTAESAIVMCGFGAMICNLVARSIKAKTHLDDTLDVFACHGVGGFLGAIMTGLFASKEVNPVVTVQGFLVSGESELFMANMIGAVSVGVFTAIGTYVLIKIVSAFTPIRVTEDEELKGLDVTVHGETSRFHDKSYSK